MGQWSSFQIGTNTSTSGGADMGLCIFTAYYLEAKDILCRLAWPGQVEGRPELRQSGRCLLRCVMIYHIYYISLSRTTYSYSRHVPRTGSHSGLEARLHRLIMLMQEWHRYRRVAGSCRIRLPVYPPAQLRLCCGTHRCRAFIYLCSGPHDGGNPKQEGCVSGRHP